MILGLTSTITPLEICGITMLDLSLLVISMGMLLLFSYTKLTIERWEGILLSLMFFAYMTYLVVNA